GWGSTTDWSGIDPRNNGKDRPDQAEDASCSGLTKELHRSETKADGVRGWGQSYAQGLALERGCTVRLELSQEFSRVHHTFHVSNLKKCYADEPLVMPLEGIHVDDKLQFMEEPVEIMEREIKRLKRSRIPLVKVRWNSRRGPEFTWEREDSFKKKYPQLFTNRASSSTTRKDQIALDEQVARDIQAKLDADLIEEQRLTRKHKEETNIALIKSWENTQAMMEADRLLAERLQSREKEELTDEEKAKLFWN
ncbi:hypothetical protein Tco_1152277, partial [Tanacetum coccineum]